MWMNIGEPPSKQTYNTIIDSANSTVKERWNRYLKRVEKDLK